MYRGMYGYGLGYGAEGFPWLHLLFGLVFLALIVAAVVALVRVSRTGGGALRELRDHSSALVILSERFAKGEIDAETYRSMKEELERR